MGAVKRTHPASVLKAKRDLYFKKWCQTNNILTKGIGLTRRKQKMYKMNRLYPNAISPERKHKIFTKAIQKRFAAIAEKNENAARSIKQVSQSSDKATTTFKEFVRLFFMKHNARVLQPKEK